MTKRKSNKNKKPVKTKPKSRKSYPTPIMGVNKETNKIEIVEDRLAIALKKKNEAKPQEAVVPKPKKKKPSSKKVVLDQIAALDKTVEDAIMKVKAEIPKTVPNNAVTREVAKTVTLFSRIVSFLKLLFTGRLWK